MRSVQRTCEAILFVVLIGCGGSSQPSSTVFEGGISARPSDADFAEVEELGVDALSPENHMQLGIIYLVGPMQPRTVRNRLIDRENRLVTCYQAQLGRDPAFRADVAVYGWLGIERSLTNIGINLIGGGDAQFVHCIRRALENMPVPESSDRVQTSVRIPLRFFSDEQ